MNRHHPYDDRTGKRGAHDMGQGSFILLPDHGRNFKRERMRELGFKLYQDFCMENDKDYKMRWWFKDAASWNARIERIEQMGYKATDKLQIS